jgi:hypothetical protein
MRGELPAGRAESLCFAELNRLSIMGPAAVEPLPAASRQALRARATFSSRAWQESNIVSRDVRDSVEEHPQSLMESTNNKVGRKS